MEASKGQERELATGLGSDPLCPSQALGRVREEGEEEREEEGEGKEEGQEKEEGEEDEGEEGR